MRGRFKREKTYVYLWLNHDVWQKPTQYFKAIILQLKINKFKNFSHILMFFGKGQTDFLCGSKSERENSLL